MTGGSLLIATRDEGIKRLKEELEREFDVTVVGDGASALEFALKVGPDLIVVDLDDLPLISGERLFHILLNNPQTREIPFLFVGKKGKELKGVRSDFDSFVSKPFNPDEIYRRIYQMISSSKLSDTVSTNREIEGTLSHLSLADLIQVLSLNRKEGLLKVSLKDREGKIYIKEGEIYDASLGRIGGEKAIYRMLAWREGRFGFYPQPIKIPRRIKTSTNNLIIEGLRQYDEWIKHKDLFPRKDSLIRLKVTRSDIPEGSKPIVYEIIHLLDFYSTAGEIADHLGYPDLEIYKTIATLIRKGVLEEIPTEEAEKMAFEEFLSSYQASKVLQGVTEGEEDEVGCGKILLLSFDPSVVRDFLNTCKRIKGLQINPAILPELNGEDFIGEVGNLDVGNVEFAFIAASPDRKMKPLWGLLVRHAVGVIFLWNENTLSRMVEAVELRRYIESAGGLPVINIVMVKGCPKKKAEERILDGEEFYTLSPEDDPAKVVWILYNLFGSFLKIKVRQDVC